MSWVTLDTEDTATRTTTIEGWDLGGGFTVVKVSIVDKHPNASTLREFCVPFSGSEVSGSSLAQAGFDVHVTESVPVPLA